MRKLFSTPTLLGYLYSLPVAFWTFYVAQKIWKVRETDACDPLSRQVLGCSTWNDLAAGLYAMLGITLLFFLLVMPLNAKPRWNVIRTGLFFLCCCCATLWAMFQTWHGGTLTKWILVYTFGVTVMSMLMLGIEFLRFRRTRKAAQAASA